MTNSFVQQSFFGQSFPSINELSFDVYPFIYPTQPHHTTQREQYQNTVKVCDELEDSLKVHVTQAPKAGRPAVLLEFNEKEKYLEFEVGWVGFFGG